LTTILNLDRSHGRSYAKPLNSSEHRHTSARLASLSGYPSLLPQNPQRSKYYTGRTRRKSYYCKLEWAGFIGTGQDYSNLGMNAHLKYTHASSGSGEHHHSPIPSDTKRILYTKGKSQHRKRVVELTNLSFMVWIPSSGSANTK